MRFSLRSATLALAACGAVLASAGGAMAAQAGPSIAIHPMYHGCTSDSGGWAIIKLSNGVSECFGGVGKQGIAPALPDALSFCAGDNYGTLAWYGGSENFVPYQVISLANREVTSVTITSYTSDKNGCAGY
jgi:hypothetical protein